MDGSSSNSKPILSKSRVCFFFFVMPLQAFSKSLLSSAYLIAKDLVTITPDKFRMMGLIIFMLLIIMNIN